MISTALSSLATHNKDMLSFSPSIRPDVAVEASFLGRSFASPINFDLKRSNNIIKNNIRRNDSVNDLRKD
jgi:hypothetical protein